jgi:hypothetical protein
MRTSKGKKGTTLLHTQIKNREDTEPNQLEPNFGSERTTPKDIHHDAKGARRKKKIESSLSIKYIE